MATLLFSTSGNNVDNSGRVMAFSRKPYKGLGAGIMWTTVVGGTHLTGMSIISACFTGNWLGRIPSNDYWLQRKSETWLFSYANSKYLSTVYCVQNKIVTEILVMLCYACAQLLSHVRLFAILWTVAHQVPLSMGFSRQKYWSGVAMPSSRGSSWPRDWTHVSYVSCIGRRVLYH